MRGPPLERWLAKVEKTPGCWLWKGTTYRGGYGHFRLKVEGKWKMYKAHRFSYETYNGPIPEGMIVRHKCDNPACVNPQHLLAGTAQDNIDDAKSRGRKSWGRNPKHNHLSMSIAESIRLAHVLSDLSQKDIAHLFSISEQQCSRILNNKIWQKEN